MGERLKGFVIMGERGSKDWFLWEREAKSTSYSGSERLNGLVIVGERV